MMDLLTTIQDNSFLLSTLITLLIALVSLYQSYKNKRKFDQLNKESLVSKVRVDFNYETEKTDQFKIVKGQIKFTNKGTTNIKLVELYFDAKDRSDELQNAFVPNTPDEQYSTISEGISSIDLLGFNNSRHLSFKNPQDKYFEVYRRDSAYVSSAKAASNFNLNDQLNKYIDNKINDVQKLFTNFEENKETINQKLIYDLLIREIRGFQLFPGESLTQEFVASYKGSGSIILNVEASSLRFLQRSITKGEEFKALVDQAVDSKSMDEILTAKIKDVLKESLEPATTDVMDHRKTFLMYLP